MYCDHWVLNQDCDSIALPPPFRVVFLYVRPLWHQPHMHPGDGRYDVVTRLVALAEAVQLLLRVWLHRPDRVVADQIQIMSQPFEATKEKLAIRSQEYFSEIF